MINDTDVGVGAMGALVGEGGGKGNRVGVDGNGAWLSLERLPLVRWRIQEYLFLAAVGKEMGIPRPMFEPAFHRRLQATGKISWLPTSTARHAKHNHHER